MKRFAVFYLPPSGKVRGGMEDFVIAFDEEADAEEYVTENSDFEEGSVVIEDMTWYLEKEE